jgi:hypothetical protein
VIETDEEVSRALTPGAESYCEELGEDEHFPSLRQRVSELQRLLQVTGGERSVEMERSERLVCPAKLTETTRERVVVGFD